MAGYKMSSAKPKATIAKVELLDEQGNPLDPPVIYFIVYDSNGTVVGPPHASWKDAKKWCDDEGYSLAPGRAPA